jgi:hypothetical protein
MDASWVPPVSVKLQGTFKIDKKTGEPEKKAMTFSFAQVHRRVAGINAHSVHCLRHKTIVESIFQAADDKVIANFVVNLTEQLISSNDGRASIPFLNNGISCYLEVGTTNL